LTVRCPRKRLARRSRRQSAVRRAEAANGSRQIRNDLLPALKLESYLIDALGSHSRRLRKSDAAHIREIANSIGALGFNIPLLIGQDNMVIDGESRLAAARQLGLASVPCIRVDHLNESEQRLLRLAVNRLGEVLGISRNLRRNSKSSSSLKRRSNYQGSAQTKSITS
jgi:hypothetical protein